MPHAVSGLHPFQSALRDRACLSGRVLIGEAAAKNDGERCDARVRMDAEERLWPRRDFEMVQEHERLDQLADIGGAGEAGDGPVPAAIGGERDSASIGAHGSCGRVLHVDANGRAGD
jgi:hypothetical protein